MQGLITSSPKEVLAADGVILPGVGAFGDAMETLRSQGLVPVLRECISAGKPFMGICLGMQLLMTESEEFGSHEGIGVFAGRVRRFPPRERAVKVPQVGWNQVWATRNSWDETLMAGMGDGDYMYFVHSYYVEPSDGSLSLAETEYEGHRYCSALRRGECFACQFHPERSGEKGLSVYRRFSDRIRGCGKGQE
jgi:glutamine amidotransferase